MLLRRPDGPQLPPAPAPREIGQEGFREGKVTAADLKGYYQTHPAEFIGDWGMTFDPRLAELGLQTTVPFVLRRSSGRNSKNGRFATMEPVSSGAWAYIIGSSTARSPIHSRPSAPMRASADWPSACTLTLSALSRIEPLSAPKIV